MLIKSECQTLDKSRQKQNEKPVGTAGCTARWSFPKRVWKGRLTGDCADAVDVAIINPVKPSHSPLTVVRLQLRSVCALVAKKKMQVQLRSTPVITERTKAFFGKATQRSINGTSLGRLGGNAADGGLIE